MEISSTTIAENHIIYILFISIKFVDNKYNEIYSKRVPTSYDSHCTAHILASVYHTNPFIDDVIKFDCISLFIIYLPDTIKYNLLRDKKKERKYRFDHRRYDL